ncbi:hypothetical protein J6524_32075 [Bradyrhizobium sp. WSM 1738]|uniref:hypothetical protein n=1 Tax=Bradyrhizobium hereditatis TaxID=2821405 RepID=UPI001CE351A1|nr:hypothetical protein [Bradyrhizobium hereditatis]MCA6119477.1 hypothetical protein [Bradyrhizobium hereditatis]
MADKPNQDFGKRNSVSVPASPRPVPPPPAKRSSHVALLLMGTFAVGSAAYTLMPSRTCEQQPPNAYAASPTQTTTECSSRSSSSSHGGSSGGGSSSSRSGYYSSDYSSSSQSSSHSGSHSVQRGGFGSFGHAIGFSGG